MNDDHRARPPRPDLTRRRWAFGFLILAIGCVWMRVPAAAAVPTSSIQGSSDVYHVKTTGSDANPGSEARPFQTIEKAVSVAGAGDTIKVHAGTYQGVVTLRKSGERNAPIVLMGAGDGPATLTADVAVLDCDGRAPTHDRTLQIVGGADNWTIRDLSIVNGILIMAPKTQVLENRNFSDRSLPGHGATPDSAAADKVLPSFGIDPSDSIRLLHLDVRGRGLLTIGARHGELADSRFHDIDCGTGAGVWLNRFSDGWHVHDNQVQNIAASKQHYMSEGIRLGSGSSYNVVERNVVEHLQGQGRGITADVGSSWNVYRANRVNDAAINYSEQAAGWGNHYIANVSQNARRTGFQVYGIGGMDEGKREEVKMRRKGRLKKQEQAEAAGLGEEGGEGGEGGGDDSTPRYLLYQCNDSQGDPVAFNAGDVTESRFLENNFGSVRISEKLRSTWAAKKNVWDGSPSLPSDRPPTASFASCRAQAGGSAG
jgi:hypothetical protein